MPCNAMPFFTVATYAVQGFEADLVVNAPERAAEVASPACPGASSCSAMAGEVAELRLGPATK